VKASQLPGAPAYIARFAGYEFARCPGREKMAYEMLKKLYEAKPRERKPTLIGTLKELEKKLDVPEAQRVH
jgi:hypothetical protein